MRRIAVALMLAVATSACAPDRGEVSVGGTRVPQVESSADEDVPSALDDPADPAFPAPLIDLDLLNPGGPPPDGIPPIDEPTFLSPADVDFLANNEAVLALEIDGDARAYPVQVLIWHEIVNDTVGGIPVAVTYCPLCNSAVAFDRRLGDRVLDFGTSGMLYHSDLVMYDRQTESLWPQFLGQAAVGTLTGERLDRLSVVTVSWADWRVAHPDGLVLSRDTGVSRPYGENPYVGYDDVDTEPQLFEGETDERLPAKTRVVGVRDGDEAVAVVLDRLLHDRVLSAELAGRTLVVVAKPGTASALETGTIDGGRDVGATGVFVPEVDGRTLTLEPDGDGFRDRETGSSWDIFGRSTAGSLVGRQLEPVEHVDTFWFAWAAFLPGTEIIP